MRAGAITVSGDAGAFVGSARAGHTQGMTGGAIVVRGNAGDRAGDRMRRGLLMIEGREIAEFQSQPEIVLGKTVYEQFDTRPELLDQVRTALEGKEIHTEISGAGGLDGIRAYTRKQWAPLVALAACAPL